ncbi:MAG: formate dehydrogenase accessory sulfurtransferase FdhD [Methylotenera sp.]|nr:formate dehydrogenase accessory sulfurtransferase FdhD [Methylotenera sp.]
MPGEASIVFSTAAANEYAVMRHQKNIIDSHTDIIAEEVPIAMVYNGISHVVMLATPQDLEDFALGFSLTEGILDKPSDLYGVEIGLKPQGIELQLEIASSCFQRLKEQRRNMTGRTGCGLCGSESLEQALKIPTLKLANASTNKVSSKIISIAFANIHEQQKLQILTGATHASAWINLQAEVELIREDVGRHNALDKLLGAMAMAKPQRSGFVLTTSRASYEMVQKTASAGINMLVAISAPTGLAIRMAEQCNLTLVGFARENSFVVYSHPENII